MHVAHVLPSLAVGGAETMLTRLLSQWHGALTTTVICLDGGGPLEEQARDSGAHVIVLPTGGARALQGVTRALRDTPVDVVQTWMYRADLIGLLAARMAGRPPVVWNVRCSANWGRRGLYRRGIFAAARTLSPLPAAVVSNSRRAVAEHTAAGYRPRRWVTVPNGFDLEKFRPCAEERRRLREELGIGPDTTVIGTVGRADPIKDQGAFLAVAAEIAARRSDVAFLLAGRNVPEVYGDDEISRRLGRRVILLREQANVPRLLNAFDIFALTSRSEGFPNALGEAMATGLPVVTTDVGDAALLVTDERWRVPPAAQAALADAWLRMLDLMPDERRRIGQANRDWVNARFSIAHVAQEYVNLYEDVRIARR